MLNPIARDFKGLIMITGPTNSGKSQFAEFLIKNQELITYIATSKPRKNDPEWQRRINIHKKRRPDSWTLIEHPCEICKEVESISNNNSLLIDSLGGLVEQHLILKDKQWELFANKFLNCLIDSPSTIIVVSEEIGWGISPATPIGHLFRERLSNLSYLISSHSIKKLLAINGIAIDLDIVGNQIP